MYMYTCSSWIIGLGLPSTVGLYEKKHNIEVLGMLGSAGAIIGIPRICIPNITDGGLGR